MSSRSKRRPKFQFQIRHLLIGISVVATPLGYLAWTGYFQRRGVWEVTAIESTEAWWHGETVDGRGISGIVISYYAVCQDGDLEKQFHITTRYSYPMSGDLPCDLELQIGDQFRILGRSKTLAKKKRASGNDMEVIELLNDDFSQLFIERFPRKSPNDQSM